MIVCFHKLHTLFEGRHDKFISYYAHVQEQIQQLDSPDQASVGDSDQGSTFEQVPLAQFIKESTAVHQGKRPMSRRRKHRRTNSILDSLETVIEAADEGKKEENAAHEENQMKMAQVLIK